LFRVLRFKIHLGEDCDSMLLIQASKFLEETKVDALAVCIGNVHGKYPASGPKLDLKLLKVQLTIRSVPTGMKYKP
jgi:fructose/tagatose bisphosphate aldolase